VSEHGFWKRMSSLYPPLWKVHPVAAEAGAAVMASIATTAARAIRTRIDAF
jgi:hypothetical protein